MDKISIIVPIYNVESYISKCIESIINQTYENIEIILVDDGSKDTSGHICDKYAEKDNRIKVIHKENGGLSSARNAGLDICSGKYIGFIDGDDWIAHNMYELLISMIKEFNCDIAICGYRETIESKECFTLRKLKNVYLDNNSLWEEIFGKLNNAAWNKLYKKDLIGNLRFPLNIIHGEDLIFNLLYLRKCKNGAINRTECYNYLKRENSITTSSFSEKKIFEVKAKDMALQIIKENKQNQIKNAEKYCFRARMNILRNIIKSDLEANYDKYVNEYLEYVKKNYTNVKKGLKLKECIEYHLLRYLYTLYVKIIKL